MKDESTTSRNDGASATAASQVFPRSLPPEISAALDAARRRVRRLVALRGGATSAGVAFAVVLAMMAADAAFAPDSPLARWTLWLAGACVVATTVHATLWRPLSKPISPATLAALLERNHPELEERLSTAVGLLGPRHAGKGGSEELLSLVARAAALDASRISPKAEFSARPILRRAAFAAIPAGTLALLFAARPGTTLRLFTRVANPASHGDNAWAGALSVSPGDTVVLRGSPLSVEAAIASGFQGQPTLRATALSANESGDEDSMSGGSFAPERMAQAGAARDDGSGMRFFRHEFPSVRASFKYRISCGRAVTRDYTVTAVPPPSFSDLAIQIEPPEYTGAKARALPAGERTVEATAGSRIHVSLVPDRPLDATLRLPGGDLRPESEAVVPGGGASAAISWAFTLESGMDGEFFPILRDSNGFTNAPVPLVLQTVPDNPPEVQIVSPVTLSMKLPHTGALELRWEASDDYGTTMPELQRSLNGGAWETLGSVQATAPEFAPEIDPEEDPFAMFMEEENGGGIKPGETQADAQAAQDEPYSTSRAGSLLIRLDDPSLATAASARWRLVACDARPSEGASAPLAVEFAADARSLALQQFDAARKDILDRISKIDRALREGADKARAAAHEAEAGHADRHRELLGESADRLASAGDEAQDAAKSDAADLFPDFPKKLDEKLASGLRAASEAAAEAAAAAPENATEAARALADALEKARSELPAIRKATEDEAWRIGKARELDALADREAALAAEAASAERGAEATRRNWAERQRNLANEFSGRAEEAARIAERESKAVADAIRQAARENRSRMEAAAKAMQEATVDSAKQPKSATAREANKAARSARQMAKAAEKAARGERPDFPGVPEDAAESPADGENAPQNEQGAPNPNARSSGENAQEDSRQQGGQSSSETPSSGRDRQIAAASGAGVPGAADADAAAGANADWFRRQGGDGGGAEFDADALDDVPAEFREQVRAYFRAVRDVAH